MSKTKEYAITIKGVLTDRLYTEYDYDKLYEYLTINGGEIIWCRYELDSKHRLHVHVLFRSDRRLPYFRDARCYGYHIYCVPNPNERWLQYCEQTSSDVQQLEHTQLNTAWRRSGNQFSFLD